MKKLAITFAALSTISGAAHSSDFAGFNAQISAGYQNTSSQIDNVNTSSSSGTYTNKVTNGDFITRLGVGYTADINNDFTIGLEGEYNPLKTSGGNFNVYKSDGSPSINAGSPLTGSFNYKNQYMISLVPGYKYSKSTLVYSKLGYTQEQFGADVIGPFGTTLNGINLGLGVKYLYTKSIYTFTELNYIDFSNKNDILGKATSTGTYKSSLYDVSIGIGYQF